MPDDARGFDITKRSVKAACIYTGECQSPKIGNSLEWNTQTKRSTVIVRASCLICHCSVGNTRYRVFVTQDDPSLTQHKKALQPLSLRREPTHSPCFPRQNFSSCNKHGLFFTAGRYQTQPAVCSFPLSLAVILGKHITATVTYCLQSSGWVATTYILHVSVRKSGNCRSFSQTLLGLYPRAKRSTVIAWDLRLLS